MCVNLRFMFFTCSLSHFLWPVIALIQIQIKILFIWFNTTVLLFFFAIAFFAYFFLPCVFLHIKYIHSISLHLRDQLLRPWKGLTVSRLVLWRASWGTPTMLVDQKRFGWWRTYRNLWNATRTSFATTMRPKESVFSPATRFAPQKLSKVARL